MFSIKRTPTHPGDILKEEFMSPLGITQIRLAKELGVAFRTVNEIINHKRGISPEMAVRLARYFGTSEELWLNLQVQYDLYRVKEKKKKALERLRTHAEIHTGNS